MRAEAVALPRPQVKADINVTPLVDVVLVLLIIFMVVTPLIASGVTVDLPRTANHARKADDGKDIIVAVTADKRFYVGSVRVADAAAAASAAVEKKRRAPEKSVFVKADTRAPYGAVRTLLESLHEADIENVILGTEEIEKR
ncbi:MAG TPA: biopolymer transporter ExbD [Polyangia bacterium]